MECDIHIIVEFKHNDKWIGLHACESITHNSHRLFMTELTSIKYEDIPKKHWTALRQCELRNYELFNELAGVRGDGPATPNGLPDDISDLSQMIVDRWGRDGHSHMHGTLRELGTHFLAHYAPLRMLETDKTEWLYNFFGLTYDYDYDDSNDPLERVRLIIFFDN